MKYVFSFALFPSSKACASHAAEMASSP